MTKVYAASEDCENWQHEDMDEAVDEVLQNCPDIKIGETLEIWQGDYVDGRAENIKPVKIKTSYADGGYAWEVVNSVH